MVLSRRNSSDTSSRGYDLSSNGTQLAIERRRSFNSVKPILNEDSKTVEKTYKTTLHTNIEQPIARVPPTKLQTDLKLDTYNTPGKSSIESKVQMKTFIPKGQSWFMRSTGRNGYKPYNNKDEPNAWVFEGETYATSPSNVGESISSSNFKKQSKTSTEEFAKPKCDTVDYEEKYQLASPVQQVNLAPKPKTSRKSSAVVEAQKQALDANIFALWHRSGSVSPVKAVFPARSQLFDECKLSLKACYDVNCYVHGTTGGLNKEERIAREQLHRLKEEEQYKQQLEKEAEAERQLQLAALTINSTTGRRRKIRDDENERERGILHAPTSKQFPYAALFPTNDSSFKLDEFTM